MEQNTILQSFKVQDELNQTIWDKESGGEYMLKSEVRDKLLEISENFQLPRRYKGLLHGI